jgi:hypothetical protein
MNAIEKIRDTFRRAPLLGWGAIGLLLLAGVLLVIAALPSGPTVTGIVRLDGQPMPTGRIKFVPLPGTQGPDAGATIEEGKYRIEKGLTGGEYRVEIQGTRKTTRRVNAPFPGELVPDEVPLVAAEYNDNSKLTSRVNAGANTLDFEVEALKSKGARPRK